MKAYLPQRTQFLMHVLAGRVRSEISPKSERCGRFTLLTLKSPRKTPAKFFVDKVFGDAISYFQDLVPVSLAKKTINF